MFHLRRIPVVIACAALALIGCSRSDNKQPPAAQAPEPDRASGAEHNYPAYQAPGAPAVQEPAPMGPTANPAAANPEAEHATTPPTPIDQSSTAPLADEQIVRIVTTVDSGEIEQAQLAQQKAKEPRVKGFAKHMVDQHSKSKQKILQLEKHQQLMPANSSVANDLADKGLQVVNSLRNVEGADFERTYMDAQVDQHQAVLDLLNARLIPSAQNPQLKSDLDAAKKMVEKHLEQAKGIQAQLER